MEIESIKTKQELKRILKFLDDQGFGHISEYDLHDRKVNNIIYKENKLRVEYNRGKLDEELKGLTNYDDINNVVNNFFSKFNPDDKIFELIKKIYIQEDDRCQTPSYSYPSANDIIAWVTFKTKYNLKDEFNGSQYISYYNLDKNTIKITFYDRKSEISQLYELIFGEECKEFSISKKYGEWINLGKIDIKVYKNNYADLRGDITKIKEYNYKSLINDNHYGSIVIKYNGKVQIIKSKND